jgi:hypothetical protein
MHKTAAVILALCWATIFGALAIVTLVAAVDGIGAAREAIPLATPLFGIEPLASKPMMAGLSLGSSLVTALFAWMMLTVMLVEDTGSRGTQNPVDLAHGGAFAIAGVLFLATILDASALLIAGTGLLLAALVLSLMLARAIPRAGPMLAPRFVRDRAIEAAHIYSTYSTDMTRSADVLPFPLRGEFARGGQ